MLHWWAAAACRHELIMILDKATAGWLDGFVFASIIAAFGRPLALRCDI